MVSNGKALKMEIAGADLTHLLGVVSIYQIKIYKCRPEKNQMRR